MQHPISMALCFAALLDVEQAKQSMTAVAYGIGSIVTMLRGTVSSDVVLQQP
jgi:hypothetical protein